MISSGSESVDEPAGSAEENGAVKAESSDEREVAADWRGLRRRKRSLDRLCLNRNHGCPLECPRS